MDQDSSPPHTSRAPGWAGSAMGRGGYPAAGPAARARRSAGPPLGWPGGRARREAPSRHASFLGGWPEPREGGGGSIAEKQRNPQAGQVAWSPVMAGNWHPALGAATGARAVRSIPRAVLKIEQRGWARGEDGEPRKSWPNGGRGRAVTDSHHGARSRPRRTRQLHLHRAPPTEAGRGRERGRAGVCTVARQVKRGQGCVERLAGFRCWMGRLAAHPKEDGR